MQVHKLIFMNILGLMFEFFFVSDAWGCVAQQYMGITKGFTLKAMQQERTKLNKSEVHCSWYTTSIWIS